MNSIFAVAVGGAIGSVARYLFNLQAMRLLGPNFPWGTLGVNLIGGFIMGAAAEAFALRLNVSAEMRSFLMTGILGGFTTFSTFSLDVGNMLERHDVALAGLYIAASVLGSILMLFLGLWSVRAVLA
ncbi:MAG TPA: fluoride efflux transporter CrcB [Parvibaculum sp.]|uniref:fluoride efflux transporter CrcB n=1 Tax=Parvibaculum sp. TaxID=2024848 RepID=UPI002B5CBAD4|nr:fluoride efflux transporter CrcB [Parvibaculum sp.]HMM15349.1 fluoride efflux transporter CrcB [Parvibaculum sp.]